MDLLLGCGGNRERKIQWDGRAVWHDLTTIDMNPAHKPDFVFDLTEGALPLADGVADEIHAYDVLEHLGQQGDWRIWFRQWSDYWRVLKPGGVFCGVSPAPHSPWAWGDPGHTRLITREAFVFLHQPSYAQVGVSPMTDYRFCYKADFDLVHSVYTDAGQHIFALQAVKPSRIASHAA